MMRRPVYKRYLSGYGYDSVKKSYFEDGHPTTTDRGSALRHDTMARREQLSMVRDLHRNNYLCGMVVNSVLNHMVGADKDFNFQIRCENEEFSKAAEKYLRGWWKHKPETRGRYKGIQLVRAIATELLTAGEVFLLKTNTGQIQLLESELIYGEDEPDSIDGIVFIHDYPSRYIIHSYGKDGYPSDESKRVEDNQHLIHVFHNNRVSGIRGIPPLQPLFDLLMLLGDIISSEAKSWDIIARIALIAERKDGPILALTESEEDQENPHGYIEDWDFARIFHADLGEDLRSLERNVPHKNFGETLLEFLRLVGSIFGIPGEFLISNFSRSNYSQSKAATIFAARGIAYWQDLIKDVLREVLKWKINTAFSLNEPPEYEIDIFLPGAIHLDPQKESAALTDKLAGGLTTMADAVGEYGYDLEELTLKRKNEVLKAIKTAREIEEETGEVVPWQLFSGLPSIAASPRQIDVNNEDDADEE